MIVIYLGEVRGEKCEVGFIEPSLRRSFPIFHTSHIPLLTSCQITIYPNFFVFKIIFSSRTTASYIIAATAASITTLAITKSS